jgi:hypothetical protein
MWSSSNRQPLLFCNDLASWQAKPARAVGHSTCHGGVTQDSERLLEGAQRDHPRVDAEHR